MLGLVQCKQRRGKIMGNSNQTKNTVAYYQKRNASNLVSVIAIAVIATWCGQSQASNLLLWGWLGVADIRIMQNPPKLPRKDGANLNSVALTKPATAVPEKFPADAPVKKCTNLTKV
jgi:hypothetical protein